MRTDASIALNSPRRLTWRSMVMALVVALGAFGMVGLVLPAFTASAAPPAIDQCNGFNPGATTGVDCTVTVVNTINGASRGSTTTVTRVCTPGVCPGDPGPFTSTSTELVTSVTQCNGSANDAAPPLVTCRVSITNNISEGTPGAAPVPVTINQCVGTGAGGGNYDGRGSLVCDPFPAATTGATVTQCNGSVTGGGSTAVCSVAPSSTASPAIPVTINQCNGTGNAGGTLLTCSASIINNITALPNPTPSTTGSPSPSTTGSPSPSTTGSPSPSPTGSPSPSTTGSPSTSPTGSPTGSPSPSPTGSPSTSPTGSPSTSPTTSPTGPTGTSTYSGPTSQIPRVPSGGPDAGGGSTIGLSHVSLLMLGGGLLLAAAISALVGCWVPRRD